MRRIYVAVLVTLLAIILISCSSESEAELENNEEKSENDTSVEVDKEVVEEDVKEDSAASENDEYMISGTVMVLEDENMIRVEAETNLLEGTSFDMRVKKAFGEIDASSITKMGENMSGFESGQVESDGTLSIDYPMHEDFFDNYAGEYIEVEIINEPVMVDDDLIEAYGENGEKFIGPFVYQFNTATDDTLQNRLLATIHMMVGEDKKEYAIEAPERAPLPDDYGETGIHVDAEVVDNDDRFLYVEGKSNILEGMLLQGRYYPEEETTLYQGFKTETYIEPDGTFQLPISYDSITSDGYIEIQGSPDVSNRAKDYLQEEYGDGFNDLSGDVVEDMDDHQEIIIKIEREGIDMDVPENSFVTEDSGELKVQLPDNVLFDFDESDLKKDARNTLGEVVEILEDLDEDTSIEINGHTDNEGEAEYNLDLSEERAKAVEDYINENGDMGHLSIDRNGYGMTKPIASNETKEGQERNRRVTIVIKD